MADSALTIARRLATGLLALACAPLAAQSVVPDAAPNARQVPPERLAHYWLLDPDSAEANVPNSGTGLDIPTCALVSYMIEKNGTTSHVKLEKVVPEGPFGKVAVSIARGMRFAPAAHNVGKDPVMTTVVIPFNLPPASSNKPSDQALRARVLQPCAPGDAAPPAQ